LPKNEDGEFELILANRQLLSVFFIVVILLGVFFTMGYIVGRNSAPLVADVASAPKGDAKPPAAETPARPPETAPVEAPAPVETTPQAPVATEPQKAEPEPVPARTEPARKASPKPPAPVKAAAHNQPSAGQTYLQLAATSRHEADIMVDVLRKKNFKAIAAEIEEKPGTFRVLVGPVTESTTNRMRADLQAEGFPGNAAIRRTF
jgi:cell division septation protein DedD